MHFPIKEKFSLSDEFILKYKNVKPKFGFGGLGEFVYMRTYSRLKADGKNEQWYETVRRVVEGVYSIQKQHISDHKLRWDEHKAQKSAREMYDRMFNFKILGSGRALWSLGTDITMQRGLTEALFNCSFISTEDIDIRLSEPFAQAMDFLMLGVGVGFDTRGAGKIIVQEPSRDKQVYSVPDDREGWVISVAYAINAFFGKENFEFDYSLIRPAGSPIRTFGGVSAGYEPLKKLHDTIYSSLSANVGAPISQRTIADIINAIGVAVVSGNVRRSAELLVGNTDEEFLDLKNYEKNPERMELGWASNNSVDSPIGMDYSDIAKRIFINGEPGVLWIDNMRKYGRMRESEANYKDKRVVGVNPCAEITLEDGELCVSGDTRILTRNGYPRIQDVVGKQVEVWNGKKWSKTTPFVAGKNKKLLRVWFSDGSFLDCTPKHKFSVLSGRTLGIERYKEVEASNLKYGDKLEKPNVKTNEMVGKFEENAFEWGFFAGDGYLDGKDIMGIICGNKDKLVSLGMKGSLGKPQIKEGYKDPVNRINFTKVLKDFEMAKHLNNKDLGIPEYFFEMDKESILEFLAGWIETDGTIQKNEDSWHYRVYGSLQKMLDLQLLLRKIGIEGASVSLASPKGFVTNLGERNRDLYYLTIPSNQCYEIPTRIKKIEEDKISSGYMKNNAHKESKDISIKLRQRVVEIEELDGEHDVFCFEEMEEHKGVFGNVLTHQCNLNEIILPNHEDFDDLLESIKYSYLFAKTITLLPSNWTNTNAVMLRNRRIGLSMTGITQFMAEKGLSELKKWMEEGYNKVQHYDQVYSEWLAVPKSIKTTTVKPSGSLSLLAGCTPGVHFPESKHYIRRVRLSKNSPYVSILKNANYKVEDASEDPKNTAVVEFPVSLGDKVKTINDVTIWEQMSIAAFAQEHWSDNAVSVTVTFKKNEEKDIESSLNFFQHKMKSVSFLPKLELDTPYKQMPYEEITKEQYDEMSKNLLPLDFSEMFGKDSSVELYCETDSCMIL